MAEGAEGFVGVGGELGVGQAGHGDLRDEDRACATSEQKVVVWI